MAAVFVMSGAFLYISAAGSPRQMEHGKAALVEPLSASRSCEWRGSLRGWSRTRSVRSCS